AIPADNPLRKHLLNEARTLCFALTRQSLAVHECPIDPNLFAMVSPRGYDIERWLEPAVLAHLQQTLLLPRAIDPACTRLYLVPHGPLHLVPYIALHAQADLATAPTITYAPNATIFRHSLTERPAG